MTDSNSSQSYEMNIIAIINFLWLKKYIIIIGTVLPVVGLYIFKNFNPPLHFTSVTKILKLPDYNTSTYFDYNIAANRLLNDNIFFNQTNSFANKNQNLLPQSLVINSDSLIKTYLEQFRNSDLLKENIIKHNFLQRDDYADHNNYLRDVNYLANSIKINRLIDKDLLTDEWQVTIRHNDIIELKNFLKDVHKQANKQVLFIVNKSINAVINSIEIIHNGKIKDIDDKISVIKEANEYKKVSRIKFLESQSRIAKSLGIEVNENFNFPKKIKPELTNYSNLEYLRGYKAIDEEIKIKQSNGGTEYSTEIYNLNIKKLSLEKKQLILRLKKLKNKLPLNEKKFRSAIMNYSTPKINYNHLYRILFIIFPIFGFLLSFLYIFFTKQLAENPTLSEK